MIAPSPAKWTLMFRMTEKVKDKRQSKSLCSDRIPPSKGYFLQANSNLQAAMKNELKFSLFYLVPNV